MVVNNDRLLKYTPLRSVGVNGAVAQAQNIDTQSTSFRGEPQVPAALGWKEVQKTSTKRHSSTTAKKRRRLLGSIIVILLIMLIFASVRVGTIASNSND